MGLHRLIKINGEAELVDISNKNGNRIKLEEALEDYVTPVISDNDNAAGETHLFNILGREVKTEALDHQQGILVESKTVDGKIKEAKKFRITR